MWDSGLSALGGTKLSLLAEAMQLTLMAAAASLGQCEQASPYMPLTRPRNMPLTPRLDSNGRFAWCCSHQPMHCSS